MSRFVDPLVVGRVIGDVVDLFVPSVAMAVTYGAKDVSNGCHVKPSMAADQPLVRISGRRNDLYTLLMTDPDAPSPSDPTMREYVHYSTGDLVLPYMGPQPPVGIHRYVLVLFEQKSRIVDGYASPPADRAYFNTHAFAANHELGLPVALVYFNSQREPAGNRRRR